MHTRRWGLLTAGVVATVLAADVAGAQDGSGGEAPKKKRGLGGFLEKVNKVVCGPDGSACAPNGTATSSSSAVAGGRSASGRSGARARVEAETVEGGTEYAAKFDTTGKLGTRRTRRACGTERTCVAGWDLRFVEVRPPADTLPGSATIPVTYVIENRGRAPSPVSEVQVCYAEYGRCGERIEQFDLPALGAGEQAEVTRPLRLKPFGTIGQFHLMGVLDPDAGTGASNRENDAAMSRVLTADGPQLQWMAFRSPEAIRQGDAVVVEFRLRNRSFAASSSPTEIQWGSRYNWGVTPDFRTPLPALAPRQTYVAQVRLLPASAGNGGVGAAIDPDGKLVWGSAHEGGKGEPMRVLPR